MKRPSRFTEAAFVQSGRVKRRKDGESRKFHRLSKCSIWDFLISLEHERLRTPLLQSSAEGGGRFAGDG